MQYLAFKRILNEAGVKVAMRPVRTIGQILPMVQTGLKATFTPASFRILLTLSEVPCMYGIEVK